MAGTLEYNRGSRRVGKAVTICLRVKIRRKRINPVVATFKKVLQEKIVDSAASVSMIFELEGSQMRYTTEAAARHSLENMSDHD